MDLKGAGRLAVRRDAAINKFSFVLGAHPLQKFS